MGRPRGSKNKSTVSVESKPRTEFYGPGGSDMSTSEALKIVLELANSIAVNRLGKEDSERNLKAIKIVRDLLVGSFSKGNLREVYESVKIGNEKN